MRHLCSCNVCRLQRPRPSALTARKGLACEYKAVSDADDKSRGTINASTWHAGRG